MTGGVSPPWREGGGLAMRRAIRAGASKKKRTVNELLGIMAKLRSPSGCPWDREQTEQTLKKFLIEEAYETLEAIEEGPPDALKEELGDLLLQIIFLSRIAEERRAFDFSDVVHTLAEKLIRRHPHVFPPRTKDRDAIKPRNAQEVVKVWGMAKAREGKYAKRGSLLDGLPLALPALERARRISQRVSRVGFDWPDADGVWEKVQEELTELKNANRAGPRKAVEEELGDLLFTLVNWARFKDISAEEALRKATRRFAKRFHQVEIELRRRGKAPEESTLEEMDHLWNEVKRAKGKR
jgi:tetrapyrrole methylase family protein / MazG family protein